jgi:hypothetical protein
MSNSEGTDKPSSFVIVAAAVISTTVGVLFNRYGCDWIALHVPSLVNTIGVPITCILIGLVPFSVGYWSYREPVVVVGLTFLLAAPTGVCGFLGYLAFGKWGCFLA